MWARVIYLYSMKFLLVPSALLLTAACQPRIQTANPTAAADVRSTTGGFVGTLTFQTTSSGLRILGTLTGLPAGTHGIHVHEVGSCEAPEFTTAGAHLNPGARQHGLENPAGAHAGDLPNVTVNAAGEGRVDLTTARTMLSELLDSDGSAIVVHAAADDQRTDPSGNTGARIACGIVR